MVGRLVPNRVRPKCPACGFAMKPTYLKRPNGEGYMRLPAVFWCPTDQQLARGRAKSNFLE